MQKRILVVDDDTEARGRLYELLFSVGHAVTCVPTAREAFVVLTEQRFDVILLEATLPDMAPAEIVPRIRGFDPGVVIVVLVDPRAGVSPEQLNVPTVRTVIPKSFSPHVMKHLLDIVREAVPGAQSGASPVITRGKVLIVDDQEAVRTTLEKYLTKRGYQVRTAVSGADALLKIKEEKPHIVLSDMRMPGMDGIMLLRQVRQFDEAIRVVMLTSAQDEYLIDQARQEGASEYVAKPCDLKKIGRFVDELAVADVREGYVAAKRILIIDDEPGIRALLTQALTTQGHVVEAVGDGAGGPGARARRDVPCLGHGCAYAAARRHGGAARDETQQSVRGSHRDDRLSNGRKRARGDQDRRVRSLKQPV